MEENNTKLCRMCCKEIPGNARKCPYCHHWQKKFSFATFAPFIVTILIIIPVFLGPYLISKMLDKGEDFTPYRDQITISDSEIKFGENKSGETVAVIGTMSNKSPVPWKEVQIEVRFYDVNGKMTDSKQKGDYSFEVPANGSAAFKVSMQREFPKEQYAKCNVAIISARDARARW